MIKFKLTTFLILGGKTSSCLMIVKSFSFLSSVNHVLNGKSYYNSRGNVWSLVGATVWER